MGRFWAVANASLSSERDITTEDLGLFLEPWGRLQQLAAATGAARDRVRRQRVADAHARRVIGRQLADRFDGPAHDVSASDVSVVRT